MRSLHFIRIFKAFSSQSAQFLSTLFYSSLLQRYIAAIARSVI